MKDIVTKKGIIIAAIAVVIALVAAISIGITNGRADLATILSEPVFTPVKSVMTSVVGTLENIYGYLYRYDELAAENERLRARVADLEEQYREYSEVSEENDRLRELLDFTSRHSDDDFDLEAVTLISWTSSNFASSFTVNRGENSGIAVGNAVISSGGYLIGTVTSVAATSATVTTVLDTTMSIGARLYSSDDTGVVEGDFNLFRQGKCRLGYLEFGSNVVYGDLVVTTGRGGEIPSGLIIGYVDSVLDNPSGNEYAAVVRPGAEFSTLANVYVIKSFEVN
ncbi:MAG: rod shape-determining protein MreC [Oscillospiraceae bacterium]|nr:rod shape-determining protein MreC [Oscillospiraceae bacterium]